MAVERKPGGPVFGPLPMFTEPAGEALIRVSEPKPHTDERDRELRPWSELRTSGLLWLINSTVFHPRGFALAFTMQDGQPTGWKLLGDGSEPWRFDGDIDELFRAAEATLAAHRIEVER